MARQGRRFGASIPTDTTDIGPSIDDFAELASKAAAKKKKAPAPKRAVIDPSTVPAPAAPSQGQGVGGADVGQEDVVAQQAPSPVGPPRPTPRPGTPIPGTFSPPGRGKARAQRSRRGPRFGPGRFQSRSGRRQKVNPRTGAPIKKAIQSGAASTSPAALTGSNIFQRLGEEDTPLNRGLLRALG